MNLLRRALVGICTGVVALPVAPCAFFKSDCRDQQQAKAEATQAPARSCCSAQNEPSRAPDRPQREKHCSGECCRISPFTPAGEKLVVGLPSLPTVAAWPVFDDLADGTTPLASAVSQPLSLNILHCQWRC